MSIFKFFKTKAKIYLFILCLSVSSLSFCEGFSFSIPAYNPPLMDRHIYDYDLDKGLIELEDTSVWLIHSDDLNKISEWDSKDIVHIQQNLSFFDWLFTDFSFVLHNTYFKEDEQEIASIRVKCIETPSWNRVAYHITYIGDGSYGLISIDGRNTFKPYDQHFEWNYLDQVLLGENTDRETQVEYPYIIYNYALNTYIRCKSIYDK